MQPRRLLLAVISILVPVLSEFAALAADGTEPPRKKFIEVGWDCPNTAFMRQHWRDMEMPAPFDGLVFKVEAKDEQGGSRTSLLSWNSKPWRREWFQVALADLKACQFARFTDNFLRFDATPGDLDWADDAGWAALADKGAICAWLVREGRQKGLCLDFESYGAKQFQFDPAKGRTFEATAALARRRGDGFMRGMAREYPAMTVLAFWLNSTNFKAGRCENPDAILAAESYGLLPAFINGMLDALPPTMTLVDGCEEGYYLDGELEYQRAASGMRSWSGPAARLVAPENRAKWRAQVQAGFGFYLDMYLNPEGNRYYFGPKVAGTRMDRLRDNLAAARAAADQYVWIYGEQCKWWGDGKQRFVAAVRRCREAGVPLGLYLDGYLVSAESTQPSKENRERWAIRGQDGKIIHYYGEALSMCPYVPEWRTYLAGVYKRLAEDVKPSGLYIDEFGRCMLNRVCWAPDHGHPVPMGMSPGEQLLTWQIRAAVPPEMAVYSEFVPSDVASQFQDGAFCYNILVGYFGDEACWSNQLLAEFGGDDIAPHYVNLQRFAFPDFKTFHIIYSAPHRSGNWFLNRYPFFNADGIYLKYEARAMCDEASRAFYERLFRLDREHKDAFTSADCEPLVRTEAPHLFANRFSTPSKTVWTVYNANYRTLRGRLMTVPHRPGAKYRDVWNDRPVEFREANGQAELEFEIGPRSVGCIVQQ